MKLKGLKLYIGIFALVVCLATWALDLTHLVIDCIYCRSERTMIGFLGILLILPIHQYLTRYLAFVAGFFGASVAAQQILLILKNGSLFPLELPLAIAALFIIVGLVFFICYVALDFGQPQSNTGPSPGSY